MIFSKSTLGQICDEGGGTIRTGPFGSQLHQSDYRDVGIPVVMPQDIVEGKISDEKIARISESDAERLAGHKLERGDIVYGRRGNIGSHSLIKNREAGWLCGTGCLRISLGNGNVDSCFLHYYLNKPEVINWIYNHAIGATMANLNTSILRSVPITFPTILTQRKIAAILSAYDDLIVNTNRRIKILEEIARLIYQEWFVDYHFPGHESVKIVDTQVRMIPEGWKVTSILQSPYFIFIRENIKPYQGTKTYYATADVSGITIVSDGIRYTYEDKPSRAQKQPILNSVWFARMQETYKVLTFTKTNINIAQSSMLSSGFAGFRAVDGGSYPFLYFNIDSEDFHKQKDMFCTGATQRSLTNEGLGQIKSLIPPRDIVYQFGGIAQPIIDEILVLQQRNYILKKTRDLLVPKLISGEVDVSNLDIEISEEIA